MAEGTRDFIIVVGNQGYGKSVWTKEYGRSKKRLLVYDPKAEYPGVDYVTPPDEWARDVINRQRAEFRFGTHYPEELELFGNMAYAAGNCTLILEECAMLFSRGEDLAPWARPIIFMGREPQLNLVLVAQRAMSIPIGIRSQASRIVVFGQTEPEDVRVLSERIGRQYRDEIPQLRVLECLDWQGGDVDRYSVRP